jgi:hypothetical protein
MEDIATTTDLAHEDEARRGREIAKERAGDGNMTQFETSADTDHGLEKESGPRTRKGTVTIAAGDRGPHQETDLNGIEGTATTVAVDRPITGGIVTIENPTTSHEDDPALAVLWSIQAFLYMLDYVQDTGGIMPEKRSIYKQQGYHNSSRRPFESGVISGMVIILTTRLVHPVKCCVRCP